MGQRLEFTIGGQKAYADSDEVAANDRFYQQMQRPSRIARGMFLVSVQVDREFDNTHTFSGPEGQQLTIEIDPSYQPLHHVREYGTVVARPLASAESFERVEGFPCEVEAGDRVYFHFHTICPEHKYVVDGQVFYLIPYAMCYCVVREGRILPLSDYVLCEPRYVGGGEERTSSGLITNAFGVQRADTSRAIVAHAPSPKTGISEQVQPGRTVIFCKDADLPLTVEGTDYFIMHAAEIIGFEAY